MTIAVDYLLDRSSAALLVFTAAAALSWVVRISPAKRAAVGLAAIAVAALIHISTRSGFEWIVSAVERPSTPGLLLLTLYAITATTGRRFDDRAEFRFGIAILALAGLALYPGAIGFLNYDPYVLGYSGYLLPLVLVAILAYAVYRRYFFVVAALNVGILGFLLSAGRSLNLWDYVIDPVGWMLAIGAWITIFITIVIRTVKPATSVPA
ncbi:MAG TPA: hypothetical protein VHC71_12590 [Hyphomicrobium sp.]|nr:hypothetical protein [Hyphomicrobium sp.]